MNPHNYNAPESFYVFIVGNCEEYPENRREQGDLGLYHEYLDAGVPNDQVCYVKDDDCTVTNCQRQLEAFLQTIPKKEETGSSSSCTTFMFYYGGHGIAKGFRTIGDTWLYQDVCVTIQKLFEGDRVLFLLDCCDSGNMSEHFPVAVDTIQTKQQQKWVLFANAPPFIMASDEGEEWVVTNSWIRGMRCATLPTLTTMMEFLADRLAVVLGDQGFGYIHAYGDGDELSWDPSTDRTWMPRRIGLTTQQEEVLDWPRLQHNIPKKAQALKYGGCDVGDSVVYKHCGGLVQDSSLQYIPPIWVFGKVISTVDSNRVQVRVHHPSMPLEKWTVISNKTELMSGLYMAQQWSLTKSFYKAQVELAKNWKYLHYSAVSTGVRIKVKTLSGGETARDAIVVDWRKFNWSPYARGTLLMKRPDGEVETNEGEKDDDSTDDGSCTEEEDDEPRKTAFATTTSNRPNDSHCGAHIPIRWCDTQELELIPLAHVRTIRTEAFPGDGRSLETILQRAQCHGPEECRQEIEYWQRQALLASIKSAGKTIVNGKQSFGCNTVKAYWPNEDKWYKAKTIDQGPLDLTLEMLASHARFPFEGEFAPLSYEEDDQCLSPTYYIEKKRRLRLC